VQILLYAELSDASYGWLGGAPEPMSIEAVTYSYSANLEELHRAMTETITANKEGQHKAVRAIVFGQQIKERGMLVVQIRASSDIQIVNLPDDLYEAWKAAALLPQ
jgi:hypothetical protein